MSTLAVKFDDRAIDVSFTDSLLRIVLADGREISAPLEWFPKLRDATERQRQDWRLIGDGLGVRWRSLDEDVSIAFLIRGCD